MEREYSEYFDFEKTGLSPSKEMCAAHKIASESGISPALMAGKTRAALFLQALLPEEKEHLAVFPLLHRSHLTAEDYDQYLDDIGPDMVALLSEASLITPNDEQIAPDIMTCFLAKKVGLISIQWDCRDILDDADQTLRASVDTLQKFYEKAVHMPIENTLLNRAKKLIDDITEILPEVTPPQQNNQTTPKPKAPKK